MFPPLTIIALSAIICLFVYKYLIQPAILSPLAKLPLAHPFCSISERWFEWQQKHDNESKSLYAAHQRCGPIVRIAPHEVSVNSIEGLRQIYTAGLEKTTFYSGKFENHGKTNLVTTLDHKSHSIQKRMISSVYAKSYVQNSQDVAVFSSRITLERFLPLLRQYAGEQRKINVMDLFQWCGIDFMSAYNFGSSIGTDFLRDVEGREAYFGDWERIKWTDFAGEKKVVEGLIMRMLEKTIQTQSSAPAPGETNPVVAPLLHSQLLKKAKQEESSEPYEELMKRCASEMLDHIAAAHETFAITMTYLVYRLSLDPAMQTALRSELLTLNPPISDRFGEDKLPQADNIDNLPLLNAVLFETLRLHAAVPIRLPRHAPVGGMTMHGYYIPEGTTVSCNAYSLHRIAEIYPRPFEWLPQRWMPGKEREILGSSFPLPEMIRRWMWAFGSGGRMCIGSNFALQSESEPDLLGTL